MSAAAADSASQGRRLIDAVMERIRPMAQWMDTNRPGTGEMFLTVFKRDYDLLVRWPQAAMRYQVWFDDDGNPHFGRFALRPDSSAPKQKSA